ncbi:MAG: RNA pseudouridine synthase [Treponema sp.]|jgi:23S rRNA pseudouridine1911/1915/1917 synthase|nr:RNA pseudouridine synthase [Treponema sp.]
MKQKALFSVVYEDKQIVAVNKASGVAVGGDRWDTAKERLDLLLPYRVFTVHRIDRDTSGLVLFARDEETHRRLSIAFESRLVKKRYIAIVHGRPAWTETACELSLVPNGDKQHRTIIDQYQGKKSRTAFRLLGSAGTYSVIEALPETGRTHQIRVHLASLGYPLVCDPLYGRSQKPALLSSFKRGWRGDPLEERPLLARLGLHALSLVTPEKEFYAPLARDMAALITQMGKHAGSEALLSLAAEG